MSGWTGDILQGFPALRVFNLEEDLKNLLYTAMNIERGAYRFYSTVLTKYPDEPFSEDIDLLARAEEGHARLIYSFWSQEQKDPLSFDSVYQNLPGDIMEGGQSFDEMIAQLEKLEGPVCVNIVEMALSIELAAYDLYRNMAHQFAETEIKKPFIAIAQAEKEHMHIAARSLKNCDL